MCHIPPDVGRSPRPTRRPVTCSPDYYHSEVESCSFFVRPLAVSYLLTLKTRPKFVVGSRRKGQEINPQSGRWSIARRPIDRIPFRLYFKSVGRTAPSPQRVERAPDPRLDAAPLPYPIEVGHLIGLSSSRCGRPAAGQKGEARSLVVREAGSRVRSAVGWYCARCSTMNSSK